MSEIRFHPSIIEVSKIKQPKNEDDEAPTDHDFSDRSEYNNNFDISLSLPADLPKQAKNQLKKSIMRQSMKLNSKMPLVNKEIHFTNVFEKEKVSHLSISIITEDKAKPQKNPQQTFS